MGKEIELTPAMLKAGGKALAHFNPDHDNPEDVARDVWEAMAEAKAKEQSSRHPGKP